MRKTFIIVVLILFISEPALAIDIILKFKLDYFSPSEKAFKDIYGGGIIYGGEIIFPLWKYINLWIAGGHFSKTGELSFTKEETSLKITPIAGGIVYSHHITERLDLFGGLGINYYQYKESNPIGDVRSTGWGAVGKMGILLKITKVLIFEIHSNYTHCRIKPADYRINIGGLEAGAALGYKF